MTNTMSNSNLDVGRGLYVRLHKVSKDYSLSSSYVYNIEKSFQEINYYKSLAKQFSYNKNIFNKLLMLIFIKTKKMEKSLFIKQQNIVKKYYMLGINDMERKAYSWLDSALLRVSESYGFYLHEEYIALNY